MSGLKCIYLINDEHMPPAKTSLNSANSGQNASNSPPWVKSGTAQTQANTPAAPAVPSAAPSESDEGEIEQKAPVSVIVTEGLAKIKTNEKVFFNPHMRFCRDLSSLWVGSLPALDSVLDGFCASGARGLRYKLENKNVASVAFVDASPDAIELAESNAKLNAIAPKEFRTMRADINRLLGTGERFDLIEIDPFGTPMPYLAALTRCGNGLDERYISVTATDTAVLCGAHAQACYKVYSARPLHSEVCHETGLRILLASIARAAAAEDWGLEPQLCISHRHYFKVLARLRKGADGAVETSKTAMTYLTHCPHCLYHAQYENAAELSLSCPQCGKKMDWGGPVWGGKWADAKAIEKMVRMLSQRRYLDIEEVGGLLKTVLEECEGPSLYYDLHELASKHKRTIPRAEDVVTKLMESGYFASRTHFSPTSVRTDAGLEDLLALMEKRK